MAHFSEVVLGRAGTGYTLVASAEGLASATSAAFDVAPAQAATLTLAASARSVTAGEPVGLTVTLSDALGNVATNYVGTVVLSSTDATAELPVAEYTFTATDAGQHTFSGLVFKRAGTAHVTVADKVLGTLLQATADVGVLPGAAAKLAFTRQPASQSVRQPLGTVQVTLTDAFDNLGGREYAGRDGGAAGWLGSHPGRRDDGGSGRRRRLVHHPLRGRGGRGLQADGLGAGPRGRHQRRVRRARRRGPGGGRAAAGRHHAHQHRPRMGRGG